MLGRAGILQEMGALKRCMSKNFYKLEEVCVRVCVYVCVCTPQYVWGEHLLIRKMKARGSVAKQ